MLVETHLRDSNAGCLKRTDSIRELHAKPGVKPLSQAVDFAVTGCRGKRNGIEIINDNSVSPRARVGAGAVSLQAGADDLPELIQRRVGAAVRRMAELL